MGTTMLVGGAYMIGSSSGKKGAQQSQTAAEQDQRLDDLETQQAVDAALENQDAAQQAAAQQAAMQQQMQQMQQQQQAAIPQAAPALSQDDKIAKLKELGSLRDAGVLSEAEFDSEKQKILAL
jgi:hypothetical protein